MQFQLTCAHVELKSSHLTPATFSLFVLAPSHVLQAWLWKNRTWHLGSITPCSREADSGLFIHFEGRVLFATDPIRISLSPTRRAATFFIDDSAHRDAVVSVEPSQPTGHLPSLPPPSDPAPPSGLDSTLPPPRDPGSPCPICMDEDDDRDARIPWVCCSARIFPPCSLRLRTGRNPACPFCRQRLELAPTVWRLSETQTRSGFRATMLDSEYAHFLRAAFARTTLRRWTSSFASVDPNLKSSQASSASFVRQKSWNQRHRLPNGFRGCQFTLGVLIVAVAVKAALCALQRQFLSNLPTPIEDTGGNGDSHVFLTHSTTAFYPNAWYVAMNVTSTNA